MARNTKSGVGKLNKVVCLLKSVHYLSIFILTDSCSSEAAMSAGQLLLSSCTAEVLTVQRTDWGRKVMSDVAGLWSCGWEKIAFSLAVKCKCSINTELADLSCCDVSLYTC